MPAMVSSESPHGATPSGVWAASRAQLAPPLVRVGYGSGDAMLGSRLPQLPRALHPRHHAHALAACVLVAVVVALRMPGIADPLGIDEGGMSVIGSEWLRMLVSGDQGTSIYGNHWIDRPPFILALYGGADLFGGQLGVRMLGLAAALAVALTAAIVGERVAGRRAFLPAGLITACLVSTPALDGDRTAGELLAAVPAVLAVALLVGIARHDRRAHAEANVRPLGGNHRIGLLTLAGFMAACAPLIKQSALDACVAAAAWCTWRWFAEPRTRAGRWFLLRDAAAFATGMVAAFGVALAAASRAGAQGGDLVYALIGFRVDVLHALTLQSTTPVERMTRLLDPAAGSGLLLVAVLIPVGVWMARTGPAKSAGAWILGGWIVGAIVGISGGGYFWAHYLLQLAAPVGVACGIALAAMRLRATAGVVLVLIAIATTGQIIRGDDTPPQRLIKAGYTPQSQQGVLAVGDFLRRNSPQSDEIVVLYARANLAYYADRRQATEFAWSSMYRALPQARADLIDAITGPDRAAWVIEWQQPSAFGMDRDGAIAKQLGSAYRRVAVLCGKPILVRSDRVPRSLTLPAQRCDRFGPEQVTIDVPVTRGFRS